MDIAIDMGGTFTDAITRRADGSWFVGKSATTPGKLEAGFLAALDTVCDDPAEISTLRHGTTVVVNALLTSDCPDCLLITTDGFRDVLEIMRGDRKDLFNLAQKKPKPLIERKQRLEVRERIAADGQIVESLQADEIKRVVDKIEASGVRSVAVCLLFSFRNPAHELLLGKSISERLGDKVLVSLSHEVLPHYREFERTSTTCINAIARPIMSHYLEVLERSLPHSLTEEGFRIMESSGGLTDPLRARRVPVKSLLSGPAGGVILALEIAKALGRSNVISFDMGGTSTDVAAVTNGEPDRNTYIELVGYPIQIPSLDIVSVGAGGSSIAWVDQGGNILVGPRSAGAVPGPACYGKGGVEPTVTDAAIALGRYNPRLSIGGGLRLNREQAWKSIETLAARLGLSREETAWGILRIVNSNMADAIRSISIERSRDPRDYTLVALGGGGGAHGLEVAAELEMSSVVVPAYPGVASAQGMLLADGRRERLKTIFTPLADFEAMALQDMFTQMSEETLAELHDDAKSGNVIVSAALDLRYAGQTHEITIPVELGQIDTDKAAENFHDSHEARYGHSLRDSSVEAVNIRVAAVSVAENKEFGDPRWPELEVGDQRREVYWGPEQGWLETQILTRKDVETIEPTLGPAIIEQSDATIVVPPDASCSAAKPGFLELKWHRQ